MYTVLNAWDVIFTLLSGDRQKGLFVYQEGMYFDFNEILTTKMQITDEEKHMFDDRRNTTAKSTSLYIYIYI